MEAVALKHPNDVRRVKKKAPSWYTRISILWALLFLALAVRLWLTIRSQGVIDGDESMVGIQAQHILQGEHPLYFYGQPYMGSLEAYLMAGIFALVGPSVWALRALPILLSVPLVGLTWMLAGELTAWAGLTERTRILFMSIASLLAALPPFYDAIVEMRMLGGYIESYIVMLALLYCAIRLTHSWMSARPRVIAVWWVAIGFLAGLGLWIFPLVTVALLTITVWIIGYCVVSVWLAKRKGMTLPHVLREMFTKLALALLAIPSFVIGFTPAILWGMRHHWDNITYILHMGGSTTSMRERANAFIKASNYFVSCAGPRVIGGTLPAGKEGTLPYETQITGINTALLIFGLLAITTTLCIVVASFVSRRPLLKQMRTIVMMPVLFGTVAALAFCASRSTAVGLPTDSCGMDLVGRYATTLALVLPFFVATALTVGVELVRALANRFHLDPTPFTHLPQILLLLVLGAYLSAQVIVYQQNEVPYTFQSSYCYTTPLDNTPIIRYLDQEHVHHVWASNLSGAPLMFETAQRIKTADPYTEINKDPWINRLPAVTDEVRHADRTALMIIVHTTSSVDRALQQKLNEWEITYKKAFFPASRGARVLVVIPLNRTFPVEKLTPDELNWFGCW